MKLSALRDFLEVAERGGVRAASRFLGVPQPAITRSIQELEKELGSPLFERHAKGVSLTPAGVAFRFRASTVRSELQRAQDEVSQLRGMTTGHLVICMSSASQMAYLPQVLAPFRLRYPDLRLDILDGMLPLAESGLKAGSIDMYVGPTASESSNELQVEHLFDNKRMVFGRVNHPLAGATSLRQLVDADWLTTSITRRAEDELAPLFLSHGLTPPRTLLKVNSTLTILSVVYSSDVLLLAPVQWMHFPPLRGVIQQIPVTESLAAPAIRLVTRMGLPLTPAGEYFATLVRRASAHMGEPKSD